MSTTTTTSSHSKETLRLFLVRGVVAITWAAVFAAVSGSLTTAVTVGAGILLVLYPLIDVVFSLFDARSQHGSVRQLLVANAAVSAATAVALGVASTAGVSQAFAVFGAWAFVTGAAQVVVAVRRRAQLGNQWPMLLAGSLSTIGGIAFVIAGLVGTPMLSMLVIYAATGGVDFAVQAWLLARRRRRAGHVSPVLSTS
ncbi:DUF308 domain-containing protein [Nocardioides iriomotensis]|uniref:DUF308 domain-containing protein n=1 Tax=Nocardioides iriomotensis TaxID=715784 RepID=A0A4Q5J7V7_9ACTN|nr:DUF308 domain-containing protein [Nocardioides iriomotensis]RYU14782.1 DUF308 domain-containing protein [Nocardioides iriomotensis]